MINCWFCAVPNGTRVQLLARESPFGLDERGNVSVRARVDRDARCPRVASTSGSAQSRLAQGGTGTVASSNSGSGSSTAASSSACRETLVAMLYSPRPDIGTQTLTVSITYDRFVADRTLVSHTQKNQSLALCNTFNVLLNVFGLL